MKTQLLTVVVLIWGVADTSLVFAEDRTTDPQYETADESRFIKRASANEKKIAFSAAKADAYLKQGALMWWDEHQCVTCHTNSIYGSERPALSPVLGAPDPEIRTHFVKDIETMHKLEGDARKALHLADRPAQVVAITRGLVEWDAQLNKKLTEDSIRALSLMFEVQAPDGSWGNVECWPPFESSNFQTATVAITAAATAPNWLEESADEEEKKKYEKGLDYLRKTEPKHDYLRLLRLWTATHVPSIITDVEKNRVLDLVWERQNKDGGWSILDFYTFKNWAEGSLPRSFLKDADFMDAPSDGHMTGLALLVLIDSGVNIHDKRIQRGVEWLLANQRESGRWWTKSLNTNHYHFITYSATAYALGVLHKTGRLKASKQSGPSSAK